MAVYTQTLFSLPLMGIVLTLVEVIFGGSFGMFTNVRVKIIKTSSEVNTDSISIMGDRWLLQ